MGNKKKHRTRTILPVSLLIMVGIVSLYVVSLSRIREMSQEVIILEKEVNEINIEGSEIRKQALLLKEILPAKEQLNNYFINRDNLVEFIDYFEEVSKKAGVTLRHSNTQHSKALNFTLLFEGGFNDCMYFIALIESLPYNLSIENVYVEKSSQSEIWGGGMDVTFPGSGID